MIAYSPLPSLSPIVVSVLNVERAKLIRAVPAVAIAAFIVLRTAATAAVTIVTPIFSRLKKLLKKVLTYSPQVLDESPTLPVISSIAAPVSVVMYFSPFRKSVINRDKSAVIDANH